MDPVSALGVAMNIITIIDVASRVLFEAAELAKAKDGFSAESRAAEDVAADVQLLTQRLATSENDWLAKHQNQTLDSNEQELRQITNGCQQVATQLCNKLRGLRAHGRYQSLTAIRSALKLVWERNEIEKCKTRLQMYREAMNSRILNGV